MVVELAVWTTPNNGYILGWVDDCEDGTTEGTEDGCLLGVVDRPI